MKCESMSLFMVSIDFMDEMWEHVIIYEWALISRMKTRPMHFATTCEEREREMREAMIIN
jgi:hypothetical protein